MTATMVMLIQVWVSPALGATTHGTLLYKRTVDHWHTSCEDNT
jgi:hypothetical protein